MKEKTHEMAFEKKQPQFLVVAVLPGEMALLRRGVVLAPDVEVHEVLVKDLRNVQLRKYVGGLIGASVGRDDKAMVRAIIEAGAR